MSIHRTMGTIGFTFSTIVDLLVLGKITILYALFIYPVNIVCRSVSWITLGRAFKKGFYKLTGLIVLILGISVFLMFTVMGQFLGVLERAILISLLLWIIYSLFEFTSYHKLKNFTKRFSIARISLIGIILVTIGIFSQLEQPMEQWISGPVILGFLFLILSSILAASGFRKLPTRLEEST